MACSGGWDWAPYSDSRDADGNPSFTKGIRVVEDQFAPIPSVEERSGIIAAGDVGALCPGRPANVAPASPHILVGIPVSYTHLTLPTILLV